MSEYSRFFLASKSKVVRLECLEISHPNFTQTYRIVRNAVRGITVTHEDAQVRAYTYYPSKITALGVSNDLDLGFSISFGDLGQVLPLEMDAVTAANGFGTLPTVTYRAYRSDVLTAPLDGPIRLELRTFSFTYEGATFEAKAPSLNLSRTGELYRIDRFTSLRGTL